MAQKRYQISDSSLRVVEAKQAVLLLGIKKRPSGAFLLCYIVVLNYSAFASTASSFVSAFATTGFFLAVGASMYSS